jgi:hypothetical protein
MPSPAPHEGNSLGNANGKAMLPPQNMSNEPDEKKSFDARLGELEAIVESLERGDTPLEELME